MANNKAFKVKNGLELEAYSKAISDTAVDIFVYDTRKDSDGGAWRKRTQGTSWYNEAASSTRGSRKEFPSVAVIVVESTGPVTIYDGDDPDLPMWMVFNRGGSYYHVWSYEALQCVSALNGQFVIGYNNWGYTKTNFIEDRSYNHIASDYSYFSLPISGRNSNNTDTVINTNGIVNNVVNDVAMTVLPNAPIDAATGLPVPTIAVATDGGVSVIKDDGTVVSRAIGWKVDGGSYAVEFDDNGYWYSNSYYNEAHGTYPGHAGVYSFSDLNSTLNLNAGNSRQDTNLTIATGAANSTNTFWGADIDVFMPNGTDPNMGAFNTVKGKYFSGRNGLAVVEDNGEIFSYITSDYNTGYMAGKDGAIKLATLSDTDATNVTGSELVTNGTFDTDTSGWTTTNFTQSSGVITSSTANSQADQTITTVSGKTYTISFDITANHTDNQNGVYIRNSDGSSYADFRHSNVTGSFSGTFTATGASMIVRLYNGATTGTISFDNVSVRLAEEDRSVNGNGLQVFGTVTKSAVATGADLVAYGGFSASNYLEQPYNSDLDFGTGDMCVMGWVKPNSGTPYDMILSRGSTGDSDFYIYNNGKTLQGRVGLGNTVNGTTYGLVAGVWHQFCMVRTGGTLYLYENGVLVDSEANTESVSDADAKLVIGARWNLSLPANEQNIALVRISATAPSPEQIAKIYEDEKVLFQENAKATLYGSSDAVTALAYDDSTNILSVGTSAGRSDFQGLRRVNNTTNAVGAAISASNGLIVEE